MVLRKTMLHMPSSPLATELAFEFRYFDEVLDVLGFRFPKVFEDVERTTQYVRYLDYLGAVRRISLGDFLFLLCSCNGLHCERTVGKC